jgi:hypothetical protein
MGKLTRIDVACNDPDTGIFCGRAMQVSYRGNDLEPDAWGEGYAFTVEWPQPRPSRFRIHRKWFHFERSQYGVGNWCWDAFWMKPREAKRLLRHLKASGKWSCTSGLVRFSNWFDARAQETSR